MINQINNPNHDPIQAKCKVEDLGFCIEQLLFYRVIFLKPIKIFQCHYPVFVNKDQNNTRT